MRGFSTVGVLNKTVVKLAIAALVFALTLLFSPVAFCASGPIMPPFRKGMTWVYKGNVEVGAYSNENGKEKETKFSKNLIWRQEVIEVINAGNVSAALLRGHPRDLWFYEEGRSPGRYLYVLVDGKKLYLLDGDPVDQALKILKAGRRTGIVKGLSDVLADDYLVVGYPLKVGEQYPKGSPEEGCMFRWSVEGRKKSALAGYKLKCSSRMREKLKMAPGYGLIYRANTDHTIGEFVPGLGYLQYSGEHHGTLSRFDVSLVEFIN